MKRVPVASEDSWKPINQSGRGRNERPSFSPAFSRPSFRERVEGEAEMIALLVLCSRNLFIGQSSREVSRGLTGYHYNLDQKYYYTKSRVNLELLRQTV